MWGLELLTAIETSVIPVMIWAAFCVVVYDGYKNGKLLRFFNKQLGIARHLVFARLPKFVLAYIPEFIKGPEEVEIPVKEEKETKKTSLMISDDRDNAKNFDDMGKTIMDTSGGIYRGDTA